MQALRDEVRVITGNAAAAYGAMLCRPDVVASYPITPQSEVVEQLATFHADGLLDAEMVEVEGENSAMNVVVAASLAGGRVFTATAAAGLAFMFDALLMAAGYRAPVVMVNTNREMTSMFSVSCGQQDIMTVRDAGWVQIAVENCQEILDSVIMAYRLAEDIEIQLPVMVCYDGFYVSFLAERVEIPSQEKVDHFLAPLKAQPGRLKLIPGGPLGCGTHGLLEEFAELRYKHCAALERAKRKVDEIDQEFAETFGRGYGGQLKEYRTEDAEIIILASGSAAATAEVAIDRKREQGIKAGLVKLRLICPFPCERLVGVLSGRKGIGVIDRSVCFGWNGGHLHMQLKAIRTEIGAVPMLDFIDGLANLDITVEHIERVIEETHAASQGQPFQEVTWIPLEE